MGWFSRKRKTAALDDAQLSGRAQKMAGFILAVQLRWAAKLNALAQKIGVPGTKLILGALLLGLGLYSGYLVLSAFF